MPPRASSCIHQGSVGRVVVVVGYALQENYFDLIHIVLS